MEALGPYKILRSLGKGGMGEVFLAYDTLCKREVALKKIKPDLVKFPTIRKRFLKEALLAAKLNHPSIISILTIEENEKDPFYVMPYVEGETLKPLLKPSDQQEESLPFLIRIFLSVCEATAHCHSKNILHRDLKPENIIVGNFGEVIILDLGLAEELGSPDDAGEEIPPSHPDLTRPGKVVGTLAYMAPERALGAAASFQSDIYSLGIILYQMLTLHLPFKRPDLSSFQKMAPYEVLIEPSEIAPYRDIPNSLTSMVKKALNPDPEKRYRSMDELIAELKEYIDGKPGWQDPVELDPTKEQDWMIREFFPIPEHLAISSPSETIQWIYLQLSRLPFPGNIKIEFSLTLQEHSTGLGILIGENPPKQGSLQMQGYSLWLGPKSKLLFGNIEVAQIDRFVSQAGVPHTISIERSNQEISLSVDHLLVFRYLCHSPITGGHIGFLLKDHNHTLSPITIYTGSQGVLVSCLAIPDALFSEELYERASFEYRRIADAFPGRWEGREAIFRRGVSLLKQALLTKNKAQKSTLLGLSLEEFGHLRGTAGAPLEYLGKALVYEALEDLEEETKCLELAIRKYAKHPLLSRIRERIVFRLHDSAEKSRQAAYHFALLALRLLPDIFLEKEHETLLHKLLSSLTPPLLLSYTEIHPIILLSFFLGKPLPLIESIEIEKEIHLAFFALLKLGCISAIKESPKLPTTPLIQKALLYLSLDKDSYELAKTPSELSRWSEEIAIERNIETPLISKDLAIWKALSSQDLEMAKQLFLQETKEALLSPNSPLFPIYSCFLWVTEGEDKTKAILTPLLEDTSINSLSLFPLFLVGKVSISTCQKLSLFWEYLEFLRYLSLFFSLNKDFKKARFYNKKRKKQLLSVQELFL